MPTIPAPLPKGANTAVQARAIAATLIWTAGRSIPDVDISALLVTAAGKVRSDADFVFYNQPAAPGGAVRHTGKLPTEARATDTITVDLSSIDPQVERVVIAASADGGTFGQVPQLELQITDTSTETVTARFTDMGASTETAFVLGELYRRDGAWKFRAVGQGWTSGLAGLASDYGITVDSAPAPQGYPAAGEVEPPSLIKVEQRAPELVDLAKRARVSLTKRGILGTRAKVALVMDHSGSMGRDYREGRVQRLAERVLAVASQLDDDGAIDFFVFDSTAAHLGQISLDDYRGAVDRLIGRRRMGTTDYAGAFRAVARHFGYQPAAVGPIRRGRKKSVDGAFTPVIPAGQPPAAEPVFAVFVTDGAPDSRPQAVKALIEVSTTPVFWKFLSIGNESFEFLRKLDDLDDRLVDNADYKPIGAIDAISDEDLLDALLDEYAGYVAAAKSAGILSPTAV